MISWMASDYFARSPVLLFPVLGLVLFMTVFLLSTLRAWCLDNAEMQRLAQMPLDLTEEDR